MKALQRHGEGTAPPVMLAFEALGITDADLARAYSVSRPMVSAWRHGTRPIPRPRRIEMLAFLMCLRERFAEDAAQHFNPALQQALREGGTTPRLRWSAGQELNKRMLDTVLKAEITPDIEREVSEEATRILGEATTADVKARLMRQKTVRGRRARGSGKQE